MKQTGADGRKYLTFTKYGIEEEDAGILLRPVRDTGKQVE
jgi:hypothetical protein